MWLVILAYLLGSIPGGYVIGKLMRGIDVRSYGSKNAGATNVLRTLGKKEAIITLIFDGLKGYIIITLAQAFNIQDWLTIVSGIAVIAGHNWPIFFKFRGGRGIATSIGIIIGLSWQVFVTVAIIGLIPLFITKYVSVGSLTGAVIFPIIMILYGNPNAYIIFSFLISILAIIRHIPNIKRLKTGTERKLNEKVSVETKGGK